MEQFCGMAWCDDHGTWGHVAYLALIFGSVALAGLTLLLVGDWLYFWLRERRMLAAIDREDERQFAELLRERAESLDDGADKGIAAGEQPLIRAHGVDHAAFAESLDDPILAQDGNSQSAAGIKPVRERDSFEGIGIDGDSETRLFPLQRPLKQIQAPEAQADFVDENGHRSLVHALDSDRAVGESSERQGLSKPALSVGGVLAQPQQPNSQFWPIAPKHAPRVEQAQQKAEHRDNKRYLLRSHAAAPLPSPDGTSVAKP